MKWLLALLLALLPACGDDLYSHVFCAITPGGELDLDHCLSPCPPVTPVDLDFLYWDFDAYDCGPRKVGCVILDPMGDIDGTVVGACVPYGQ